MPLLAAIPAGVGLASAIGAGAGALSGGIKAKMAADKEAKDRALAADTQRFSPWTGLQAGPIEHANPVGDIFQGAVGGGMFGQGLGQQMQGPAKFDAKDGKGFFDPYTGKQNVRQPE